MITPAGLRNNFLNEGVHKFTGSKGQIVRGTGDKVSASTEYVIVSYAAFRRNPQGYLNAYRPDTIIADEFHRAGNPDSQNHRAVM